MVLPLEALAHPESAVEYLGKHLFDGTLALMLGAGVSSPLGLPSFKELLRTSFTQITEPSYSGSELELGASRLAAACAKKGRDLAAVVRESLYRGGAPSPSALVTSARMG